MTMLKKTALIFLIIPVVFLASIISAAGNDRFEQAKKYLDNGVNTYEEELIRESMIIFTQLSEDNQSEYEYPYYTALAYLGLCELKNFEIARSSVKKRKKDLKKERVVIAEEGIRYAEKSIELKGDYSDSYRVYGALLSNRISGMISGMRNGKLAEKQIKIALELDSNNAMAHIENARMYINKPRLLGGDVDKGIEILGKVINDNPGLIKGYINLGIAYQEKDETGKAVNTFKKLLEISPGHPEATYYLDKLMSTK